VRTSPRYHTAIWALAVLLGVCGCQRTPPAATVATVPSSSPPAADLPTLARAADTHPGDAKAQARYGSALAEAGNPKEGFARLRRAVVLDPGLTAAWHNLGLTAEQMGWLDVAADAYTRVVAAKPDLAGERVKLGYTLIALGRYDEAERAFQRAAALQPRSSETLVALASSYYAHFRFDDALDALRRAATVNPRSAAAHVNTAAIQVERRRFLEAEAAIRAALRIEPNAARYHLILGRVLTASPLPEKRAEARREAERALALDRAASGTLGDTGRAEAHDILGQAARDAGDRARAVSHWRQALALDPDRAETLLTLGQALVRGGGAGAAEGREMLHRYEQLQKRRDRLREEQQRAEAHPGDAGTHLRFGAILLAQGNIPRAVWELKEAVRLAPRDAVARRTLADALRRQGRDEEAAIVVLGVQN
jgi:tetratricopeptide (TPR) repeat protein